MAFFTSKHSFLALAMAMAGMALSFIACEKDQGKRNIEAYYFPLDKLADGMVYEYQPVENPDYPVVYWYYKSMKVNGQQYLLGMSYDPAFSPDQFTREERVDNGMLLADFYTLEADSTGTKQRLQATIEAANVFPFEVKEPYGVLLSSLHWRPLGDSSTITLVKNRQFDSDTTIIFKNEAIPAINFNTRELADQEVIGHMELEFGGTEVYAKGIGLVYFKKDIDGWLMQYRLADRYSMEDFEKKFKARLENLEQVND